MSGNHLTGLVCNDINECEARRDDCLENAICVNTPGSFTCDCPIGFDGYNITDHTTCDDVNECKLTSPVCDEGEECLNTHGSYSCGCIIGYVRADDDQDCIDFDECENNQHNCDVEKASCFNTPGSFECPCITGYLMIEQECQGWF